MTTQHGPGRATTPEVDEDAISTRIAAERAALEHLRTQDPTPHEAEAQIRWDVATTTADADGRERPTSTFMDVVADGPSRIAHRMLGGLRGQAEHQLLQDVTGELEQLIRDRLTDYAARVLAARSARESVR